MTDKEKLQAIISEEHCPDSLEDIFCKYLFNYYDKISVAQVSKLMTVVNNVLQQKVVRLNMVKSVASERAGYLKSYLNGEMWLTEEAARANLEPQILNAQAIIDACKEC